MKCKDCPEGRRFARGSIECPQYGIIIRADHEGTREGCKEHEREQLKGGGNTNHQAAELPKDFWPDIDSMPEFLYGT